MKRQIYLAKLLLIGSLIFNGCKKKEKTPEPTPVPTPSPLAVVSTASVVSISEYAAVCGGNVTSEGSSAISAVGVCWNTNSGPTTLNPHTNNGAGTGSYTSSITSLQPGTTYYVRAYATNANGTAYGNEITFKTLPAWYLVNNALPPVALYCVSNGGKILAAASYFTGVTVPFYVSNDNGATWTPSYSGITGTMEGMEHVFIDGANIYASGDAKQYKSTDNGANWTLLNWPFTFKGDISAKLGTDLFSIGYNGNGVLRSSDNGNSWTPVNNGITDLVVGCLFTNGTNIYAGTNIGGCFRSSDNGNNWTPVNNGLTSTYVSNFASIGSNVFAISGQSVFMTADNGNNWTNITNNLGVAAQQIISYNGKLYVKASNNGVFVSSNNGGSWSAMNTGLPAPNYGQIFIHNSSLYIRAGLTLYAYTL